MESGTSQNNIPPVQKSIWVNNPKLKSLLLALMAVFMISGISLAVLSYTQTQRRQKLYELTEAGLPRRVVVAENQKGINTDTSNWKTYRDSQYNYEFRYPEKILLSNEGETVSLNHQIPYRNSGECDMVGGDKIYELLTDFSATFKIVDGLKKLNVIDGELSAGGLQGVYEYNGAEGCGETVYYFPFGSDKTLVIKRANVQILSGLRNNSDEREQILKILGAISKEENDRLFKGMLETFRFTQ